MQEGLVLFLESNGRTFFYCKLATQGTPRGLFSFTRKWSWDRKVWSHGRNRT